MPRPAALLGWPALLLAALAAGLLLVGCAAGGGAGTAPPDAGIPPALLAGLRPIGRGARFHPPADGPVGGPCRPALGARTASHVELFAANRVVLIAAGVGTRPPRRASGGRIVSARCYGPLVTLDPTGTVWVRRGRRATIADLFRAWGQPLSARRLASFTGRRVAVFVGGRPVGGPPGPVALAPGAEIVLQVGPHVPPHRRYVFPSSPS